MSACPSSEWCQVLSLLAAWWQFRQPDVTGRGYNPLPPYFLAHLMLWAKLQNTKEVLSILNLVYIDSKDLMHKSTVETGEISDLELWYFYFL